MNQSRTRFKMLEQYAALDPVNLPEGRYELVDGEIVEMGAENLENVEIASLLFSILLQFCPSFLLHWTAFRGHDCIASPTFPALNLTAHQVLSPRKGVWE